MSQVNERGKRVEKNKKGKMKKGQSFEKKVSEKEAVKNVVEERTENDKKQVQKSSNQSPVKTFLKIFSILFILLFVVLYYMRFIETKMLFVKEVTLESSLIPESLSGLKVVQFSDLHYGITTGEKELDKLVQKIQLIRPDILVFTGDLLDSSKSYQEDDYNVLIEALSNMEVPISKYYIKGNQDYFNEKIDQIFERAGFVSLNNQSDMVYGNNTEKIQLVGMGSFLKNDFQMEEAFKNTEDGLYTIALFHEPDNIMELKNKNIQLALAGHSHNNQNGIPYLRDLFTKEGARTYYDNHYQIQNTEFFINSGIGTGHHKLRIFAPPTINLYRLVRK